MKKILFAIAIIMTVAYTANAQGRNDAFVTEWGSNRDIFNSSDLGLPTAALIGSGSYGSDQPAPLGSGLLVLTALGAGYAVVKKRKK